MATVREPFVQIQEQIIPAPAAVVGNQDMITAGVVASDAGEIGPTLVSTQQELLDKYTIGGKITAQDNTTLKNAYRVLASGPVYVTRSTNTQLALAATSLGAGTDEGVIVNTLSGNLLDTTNVLDLTVDTTQSPDSWSVTLGDILFAYDPDGTIVTPPGKLRIEWNGDFSAGLQKACIDNGLDLAIVLDSTTPLTPTTTIKYEYTVYSVSGISTVSGFPTTYITAATVAADVPVIPANAKPAFALIPKSFGVTNYITVDYALTNPVDTNRLIIIYNGTQYLVSMDPADVDTSGQQIYITYLNDLTDLPFTVMVLNQTGFDAFTAMTDIEFGEGIGYSTAAAATPANMIAAALRMVDQEDQLLTFVCDFNFTNTAFQNALLTVANSNYAFPVFSIPTNITNAQLAINYRTQTGINTDKAYFITPNDLSASIFGFQTDFAAGVVYIETVIANANRLYTYAGAFGSNNGTVGISKLTVNYKKADRELMLGSQINSIIIDRANGANYINNNITATPIVNVMQEENNRRLALRINRDAKVMMRQFFGEQNTTQTQKRVRDVLSTYFDSYIMNQYYRPEQYRIVCDDTNNTTAIKLQNKLAVTIKVQYRNSIKEVDVLHQIYSIGTEL